MKNQNQPKATPFTGRFRRSMAISILLAMAILTIGVVAGISKQRSQANQVPAQNRLLDTSAANARPGNPGSPLRQTAQIKPLTQEEAEKLAAALKVLANQSAEGLASVRHPDGSVSMDLQGHFQNVVIARKDEDGNVSQSCVDNPAAGAAFFGIDPALVGVKSTPGSRAARTSPANK
jgi:hypothetical protein